MEAKATTKKKQEKKNTRTLVQKLSDVKGLIGPLPKDGHNKFTKSKYTTLDTLVETLQPILKDHGLLTAFIIEDMEIKLNVFDTEAEEESYLESKVGLSNLIPDDASNKAHALGSAITYARRYLLSSMFDLASETDDDGNASTSGEPSKAPKDDLPWLSEDQFENMKAAIDDGNGHVVRQRMSNYKMKKTYRSELLHMLGEK